MDTLGKHILCELSGCALESLNNVELVRETLLAAAVYAGATIVTQSFHKFEPQGVSGVVVISESHLSIHTWPERGYAAMDFYTCGNIDPRLAMSYCAEAFGAKHWESLTVRRGIEPETIGTFGMRPFNTESLRLVPR